MAKTPPPHPRILELARRGAELRLEEIVNEIKLLLDLFPDLKDTYDPDELPVSYIMRTDANREAGGAVNSPRLRARAGAPAVRRQRKRGRADRGDGTK